MAKVGDAGARSRLVVAAYQASPNSPTLGPGGSNFLARNALAGMIAQCASNATLHVLFLNKPSHTAMLCRQQ